jgi:hypothetical protein
MLRLLIILPCFFVMFQPLNAKVDPPNYDFSIETLADFYPGKSLDELEKKYGRPAPMRKNGATQTVTFSVTQIRYKFPVVVQAREGKVLDFFAKLPSYFLHDIFFQSLVNRLGKQNSFKKVGEEAVYQWEKDSLKHVYSAACTITCFPIFYTVFPIPKPGEAKPIIESMKESVPKF